MSEDQEQTKSFGDQTFQTLHIKWRPVVITKVENGFIVNIGCKTFVASSWAQVSDGLIDYWDDPATAEKKYLM